MSGPDLPLDGIEVVDLGQLIPAPAATLNLAWLGAHVTKIEPPGGDPARRLYDGAFFELYNRGKSSLELDLTRDTDRAVALQRCAEADVVVEAFRPGVSERLGVGEVAIRAHNPEVIHCSITGYGPTDPTPGHDLSFLARSGALAEPATYSAIDQPPRRPAIPIADLAGAATATQAILAALLHRERGGGGSRLEIVLQEAVLHWVAPRAGLRVLGTKTMAPERYLEPANDLYATADGRAVVVAAIEDRHWRALCDGLGEDADLPDGASSWDWRARRQHAAELARALSIAFSSDTRDRWVAHLRGRGVPIEPVLSIEEAFQDPWVLDRGLVTDDGWVRPPLPLGRALPPAPALGEDRRRGEAGQATGWQTPGKPGQSGGHDRSEGPRAPGLDLGTPPA